jgi:hypothetical protein
MLRFSFVVLLFVSMMVKAQTINLTTLANLPAQNIENSGVIATSANSLWGHNDSGGLNELYNIDTLGNLLRTIEISNAINFDWEDITQDDAGHVYIGDFGNNNNDRLNLRIYKITNPDSLSGNSTQAQMINFFLSDQTQFPPNNNNRNFDIEAMVWMSDSLFLFTKNRTNPYNGICKMYVLPDAPGNHTAQLRAQITFCQNSVSNCSVTGAALSPDKKHLALLGNNKLWWFSCFEGTNFFGGKMRQLSFTSNTQKEGIAFKNGHQLYITDEFDGNFGGKLYQCAITDYTLEPAFTLPFDSITCPETCEITLQAPDYVSFQWCNGGSGISQTISQTGTCCITATAPNLCELTQCVQVNLLSGLTERQPLIRSYYINPENRQIHIRFEETLSMRLTYTIYSANGSQIQQTRLEQGYHEAVISLRQLPAGMYILQLSDGTREDRIRFVL